MEAREIFFPGRVVEIETAVGFIEARVYPLAICDLEAGVEAAAQIAAIALKSLDAGRDAGAVATVAAANLLQGELRAFLGRTVVFRDDRLTVDILPVDQLAKLIDAFIAENITQKKMTSLAETIDGWIARAGGKPILSATLSSFYSEAATPSKTSSTEPNPDGPIPDGAGDSSSSS